MPEYVDVPSDLPFELVIEDHVQYYTFSYKLMNQGFDQQGDTVVSRCPPGMPYMTNGFAPEITAFQHLLPTKYLGSQDPYPDPVIAVQFVSVALSVSKIWTWTVSGCGAGLEIGENHAHWSLYPETLDINGDVMDYDSPNGSGMTQGGKLIEKPVGTWDDLYWRVDTFGTVHRYMSQPFLGGWARKTVDIPPDTPPFIPPNLDFAVPPPCPQGVVEPGALQAGASARGKVDLDCPDCG